jgi:serine/threonine-protein kinase
MSNVEALKPLPPETVLDGAYLLSRVIFEGGMGTVYEGQQLRLHRRVAIKVMAPELAANEEALARFRREVEVMSSLAHPNIVQLLDFGRTPNGRPYLVMEYLPGEDLEQRLGSVARLGVPATVRIVKQVASALAVTHATGIVHRDLKPANLFLLPIDPDEDFVKLVDFGISKVQTARAQLTRAFTMLGTPEYMSPEQSAGRIKEVDHRSDQWALACITWRMLSGTLPFTGKDLSELIARIQREEPPALRTAMPDRDAEIERVLRRALAKSHTDRFPTITAFSRALEAAASPPTVAARPRPPELPPRRQAEGQKRRSPWLLVAVALVSAAVGGALVYGAQVAQSLLSPAPLVGPEAPERAPARSEKPGGRPRIR